MTVNWRICAFHHSNHDARTLHSVYLRVAYICVITIALVYLSSKFEAVFSCQVDITQSGSVELLLIIWSVIGFRRTRIRMERARMRWANPSWDSVSNSDCVISVHTDVDNFASTFEWSNRVWYDVRPRTLQLISIRYVVLSVDKFRLICTIYSCKTTAISRLPPELCWF